MNHIDLHMHSKFSIDGEYSPESLLEMAYHQNLQTVSITDHNSVKAYQEITNTHDISLIPGIELDCRFQGKDFHLLGYGIDIHAPIYKKIEQDIMKQEQECSQKRLSLIKEKLHLEIDEEKLKEVSPFGIYVPETLCEIAMKDDRNKNNPHLQKYFPNGERSDNPYVNFYWDYCSQGKIAYTQINYISMEEAIEIYHQQGAIAILAHPGNNVKEDMHLMDEIRNLGIDGIEVYSSYHRPKQVEFYHNLCQKYNLIETAGSDFHGKTKPNVSMGFCHMPEKQEKILIKKMFSLEKVEEL